MKTYKHNSEWTFTAQPNEDREGDNVFIEHSSGQSASLACAEGEGELDRGKKVPASVISAAYRWIEKAGIDY